MFKKIVENADKYTKRGKNGEGEVRITKGGKNYKGGKDVT